MKNRCGGRWWYLLTYFSGVTLRNFQRGLISFRRGGGVIEKFSEEFHGALRFFWEWKFSGRGGNFR